MKDVKIELERGEGVEIACPLVCTVDDLVLSGESEEDLRPIVGRFS